VGTLAAGAGATGVEVAGAVAGGAAPDVGAEPPPEGVLLEGVGVGVGVGEGSGLGAGAGTGAGGGLTVLAPALAHVFKGNAEIAAVGVVADVVAAGGAPVGVAPEMAL